MTTTLVKALVTATVLIASPVLAASSPAVTEDVPVPGGTAALGRALGIDPVPDRARFVTEIARLVHGESAHKRHRPGSRFKRLVAHLEARAGAEREPADLVPMPLPAAVWGQAVFRRPMSPATLFAAVMSDPAAALVAHGLAALDDETLEFLIEHPAIITRLYERHAPVFAAFAQHVRIRANVVVPPGGDEAAGLWEALLEEKVGQPDRFLIQLFARDDGRLAYLFDTIGHLDAARARFAIGLWIEDASVRIERFKALAFSVSSMFGEWEIDKAPFVRPAHDLLSMLLRIQVAPTGAPGFPADRAVWTRALSGPVRSDEAARQVTKAGEGAPIDAAWLAERLLSGNAPRRSQRLDQFAFGHRAFAGAGAAALPDVISAAQAFPRVPMLMLALERMGVRRPSIYAALARRARRFSELDALRGRTALAQFQGAIALVARLVAVRSIDRAAAEELLIALGAVPHDDHGRYGGGIASWVQSDLHPLLPPGGSVEDALLRALAGAPGAVQASRVSWEGQQYRVDLVAAEARRLRRICEGQGGPSIDAALDLQTIARELARDANSVNVRQAAAAALDKVKTDVPQELQKAVGGAIERFGDDRGSNDGSRGGQVAEWLTEVADVLLGEALAALAYAVAVGGREGRAQLAADAWRRHDFGFDVRVNEKRVGAAWAWPKQVTEGGVPWHVQGALLGLDIALARLGLRRIYADPLRSAPTINSVDYEAFAVSLALMNPFTLSDASRDAIAEAVARGRRRIDALAVKAEDPDGLAREIAMDGWRVRAMRWTIDRDPPRTGSFFSMTDLLHLGGGGDQVDLHPWGMSALPFLGCLCTRLMPPGLSTALIGRPQVGVMATLVADLNLRVAVVLGELGLPASLAPSVLSAAVQDFLDEVRPADPDDWLALVRTAQSVSRERIEDYVAAATAGGPLVPETSSRPPLRLP